MKYSLIAVLIVILAVAGLAGYSYMQSNKSDQMVKESMMSDDSKMNQTDKMVPEESMMKQDKMATDSDKMMADDKMMMSEKKYLPFSQSVFENAATGKRVLFFFANWCPTCKPADADFQTNMSKIPDGVTLIRVNYNDTETDQAEKDLAKKYTVTYQHTFVQIDANGKEITKWNGGQTEELLAKIK
jgi:thiol-disulfide isomerase/thioredoxin